MKARNGIIEIAEFRPNAKLNFCHPLEKENKMTLKVKKSKLLIAKPFLGVSINRIPL